MPHLAVTALLVAVLAMSSGRVSSVIDAEPTLSAAIATQLTSQTWQHIPGPSPILHTDPHGCVSGPSGPGCNGSSWAGGTLEMAGGVHKDNDKYYLFFHASPHTGPYRMGVAVAASPLGPFRMSPANPILTEGKNGTWDDYWVASGNPFRRKAGDWIMLFSARCGGEFGKRECDGGGIGLAYAPAPEGPWTKHPRPVIDRAQGGVPAYVASVVFAKGKYHLYCENETAADMGTIAHWTAAEPEGPWQLSSIPALLPGPPGTWDFAGFSESRVNYVNGVFHLFYSSASQHAAGRRQLRTTSQRRRLGHDEETIGYAFSLDGYNFTKSIQNPVVRREAIPGVSAMAESHAYHEPPFVYVYHTTRWFGDFNGVDGARNIHGYGAIIHDSDVSVRACDAATGLTGRSYSDAENLGVEILTTASNFKITWPALQATQLGSSTVSDYSPPIAQDVAQIDSVSVTVACPSETAQSEIALRLIAITSADGQVVGKPQPEPSELLFAYDSQPVALGLFQGNASLPCRGSDAGQVLRWSLSSPAASSLPGSFARIAVENLGVAVVNLTVSAILTNL